MSETATRCPKCQSTACGYWGNRATFDCGSQRDLATGKFDQSYRCRLDELTTQRDALLAAFTAYRAVVGRLHDVQEWCEADAEDFARAERDAEVAIASVPTAQSPTPGETR